MSICSCCHSVAKAARLAPIAPTLGSSWRRNLKAGSKSSSVPPLMRFSPARKAMPNWLRSGRCEAEALQQTAAIDDRS
jgi:hypothetical protein